MYARLATRAVGRRGFHTTRAQFSSPYHYPEGPYTNIPFNPRSKWFAFGYWGFMATGFGLPFATSGELPAPFPARFPAGCCSSRSGSEMRGNCGC